MLAAAIIIGVSTVLNGVTTFFLYKSVKNLETALENAAKRKGGRRK